MPISPFLPDGSICHPDLIEKRYARPFASGNTGDAMWAKGQGFWLDGDVRTPTERDRARILYSNSLYRLSGVTQVVSPREGADYFHNRLSHSLKVSDLAGAIAAGIVRNARHGENEENRERADLIVSLGGLDVFACEAAGLAHDIGHPPFGHAAEGVIDNWLRTAPGGGRRGPNGFEGNAQSFRAISRLNLRSDDARAGLELTAVTLAAVLKYPWVRAIGDKKRDGKFGAYHSEGLLLEEARAWFEYEHPERQYVQTLEASIMDLADDITYAVHDLQDFIAARLVTDGDAVPDLMTAAAYIAGQRDAGTDPPPPGVSVFLDLAKRLATYYPGYYKDEEFAPALKAAAGTVAGMADDVREVQREAKLRTDGSALIGDLMSEITITESIPWNYGPHLYLKPSAWHLVQILKEITKAYVVSSPSVGLHQQSETVALERLLDGLEDWVRRSDQGGMMSHLPQDLQSAIVLAERRDFESTGGSQFDDNPHSRAIIDFCCSLQDAAAHKLSRQVHGDEVARIVT